MAEIHQSNKIKSIMEMKLSVGQVIAGVFTTITTVVMTMIYVQNTYETKIDSEKKYTTTQEQMKEIKGGQEVQAKLQTEIYGDVKKISGILESQMAEKSARGR